MGCPSEGLASQPSCNPYIGEDGPWGSYLPLPPGPRASAPSVFLNVNVSKRTGCVAFTLHFFIPWKRMQIHLECRLFSNVPERVCSGVAWRYLKYSKCFLFGVRSCLIYNSHKRDLRILWQVMPPWHIQARLQLGVASMHILDLGLSFLYKKGNSLTFRPVCFTW